MRIDFGIHETDRIEKDRVKADTVWSLLVLFTTVVALGVKYFLI